MYERGFGRAAPIKVGEEVDVKIEGVGEKGDGIARVEGFVLFVPGVRQGDEVRVRVTRVLSRVGFAEVVGEEQDSAEPAEEAADTETEEPVEQEAEEAPEEETPVDTTDFGEE